MTKIQLRRDTAANWSTNNPTPSAGEPCFETDTGKLKIGDGITAYNSLPYQGGSGLEVCDIGMALYVDETKGLRRYLNGQIVDINTNTQAFLNRLKEITTLHPSLLCTEEEWQTAKTMSAFGQVGKFVFNYSGEDIVSVRLPRVVNVQGLFDLQNLGMTVDESLPNITGTISAEQGYLQNLTGAFDMGGTRSNAPANAYSGSRNIASFDASRSSSTYQDNAPVQQEAVQYPYFIQIATGAETENNIINEIELNNPFSLFDSKYSDHELNNLSWLKSEGQWNAKAVYTDAYDELLREYNDSASVEETEDSITFKRTPKGYKIALANQEAAIDTKYSTDGIAWYYILDTANEKFKLPRTKFGFEGLRTNVGDKIDESLPNITGSSGGNFVTHMNSSQGDGALWYTKKGNGIGDVGTNMPYGIIDFDASRSSSTYQDGAPVQERATQMYLYFYVGETVQNANLIDAGRIGEQVATKTDMLQASSAGMPSSKYIDLTLGTSGTEYTAPANGWVVFTVQGEGFCSLEQGELRVYNSFAVAHSNYYSVLLPVRKGAFKAYYNTVKKITFRFIYAVGSSPTV